MTTPAHDPAEPRVLCVSAFADLGGAERSLLDTVTCLSSRGFAVEVLNLAGHPGTLAGALKARAVPLHFCRVQRFRDPRAAVRVAHWFVRHARRFSMALANDTRAALYTALGATVGRIPYVWHVRDLVGSGQRLERVAVRLRPAAWIANSHAVASSLVRQGCPAAEIVVVHNGVDVDRFDPSVSGAPVRRELGIDGSALVVGAIGRLVPWKSVETLLHAADRLVTVLPQAVYVIVGEAVTDVANRADALRYRDMLVELRDRLGLGHRVRFLGERSDIPSVMAALDIVVHSAIDEPFGRVLIEAMAAGKPVIAVRGGGVTEIVEDASTGYVVSPRDDGAVADRIVRLADANRRSSMGRAGRQRAVEHFSLQAYGDGVAAVVRRVAKQPSADVV
jgi:glycosyltransferase involved in cell wall biosynthesis